jgi:hypothetical protein
VLNEMENDNEWRIIKIFRRDILEALNVKNSVALVRKRTIPTEQPPLVGEVSDNFCVVSATSPYGR